MRKKRVSQRRHALRRAEERLGLRLEPIHLQEAVRQIRLGKAELLDEQSRSRSVYRVVLQEQPVIVVYDRKRGTIATFLTEQQAQESVWRSLVDIEGEESDGG